jgi:hypothetical protein
MNQYFLHRLSDAQQLQCRHRTKNFFLFTKQERTYSVMVTMADSDLETVMDKILSWIGKNVDHYWSFVLDDGYQLGADKRIVHFSFDDIEEMALFRLTF